MAKTMVPVSLISGLDERIQDVIGASLAAGANITISYNDATGFTLISASGGGGGGGGVTDGDKGDVVVSASGATWTIDPALLTNYGRSLTAAADASAARIALELGTAATQSSGTFALSSHGHTTANISDFNESVDDRIAALLVAGANITLSYNDASNTLTIAASHPSVFSSGASGLVPASGGGTVNFMRADGQWQPPPTPAAITLGTTVSPTSGSSVTFTGIPSGAKTVTISFFELKINGTNSLRVQLGTAASVITSGYVSMSQQIGSSTVQVTDGFNINTTAAGMTVNGHMTLTLLSSGANSWVSSHNVFPNDPDLTGFNRFSIIGAGSLILGAPLTRITVKTSGLSEFVSGAINIQYGV